MGHMVIYGRYTLVNIQETDGKVTIFKSKLLVYQRVFAGEPVFFHRGVSHISIHIPFLRLITDG